MSSMKLDPEPISNLLPRQGGVYSPAEAWLDLMLRATEESRDSPRAGEVQASYGELAGAWAWTSGKVRRFLADRLAEGVLVRVAGGTRRARRGLSF